MVKGKTVVFCFTSRGVSYQFLKSFVQLCFDLVQNGLPSKLVKIIRQWSTSLEMQVPRCERLTWAQIKNLRDGKLPV